MISLAGMCTVLTVVCLCGLLAFAKYYDCDILQSGKVDRAEQVRKNTYNFIHLKNIHD